MLIQPGTKILLAGTSTIDAYNPDFALAQYNYTDGSLDTNFNGTGILVQDLGNREAEGFGTAIQADGKIIVAGSAYDDANLQSFMVARYLPTGILDPSFGTNGVVITVLGTNSSGATAIALQPDGKILVGGRARPGSDDDFAVLRYTTNGLLDTTWNGTGKVLTGIGPSDDQLHSVKVQSDGKVIAAGGSSFPPADKFTMARYTTTGALDNSFGSFGRVATQFGSGTVDIAVGMALQSDGKIVLAGLDAPSSLSDID